MNADGSSVRRLRDPTLYGSKFDDAGLLAWSPDGALIAFEIMSYEQPPRVALVTADGASERYLTSPWDAATLDEDSPAWSPDGSRIAFTSIGRGLITLDIRSGATTTVFAGGEFGSRPAWSPDGRLIAFNTQQAVPVGHDHRAERWRAEPADQQRHTCGLVPGRPASRLRAPSPTLNRCPRGPIRWRNEYTAASSSSSPLAHRSARSLSRVAVGAADRARSGSGAPWRAAESGRAALRWLRP